MSSIDTTRLSACIHCGLCLEACPTYRQTGEEMSSPRGRLYLMRNYVEGKLSADNPEFAEHEFSCLACRACETACPSGVEFGILMEQTRSILTHEQKGSSFRKFLYTRLLRSRTLLNFGQFGLMVFSKLGLLGLGKKIFRSERSSLRTGLSLLPQTISAPRLRSKLYKSKQPNGNRIGLLLGCIGDTFTMQVNDATIRVLNRLGYDVDVLPNVPCCGALAAHAGYLEEAKAMASHNVQVLRDVKLPYIVSNIAGCGAMLKEYETLLTSTEFADTAKEVRKKTFDINEFLYRFHYDDLRQLIGSSHFFGLHIAYQSPCHLLHGQRIVSQPIELLRLLPGATVVALEENELCCGSAGSYNIEHPAMAESLRKRKMEILRAAAPGIVATANAGCMLQLSKENTVPVRHVIELLDEALSASESSRPRDIPDREQI